MIIKDIDFPIYITIIVVSIIIGMLYIFISIKKEKEYNNTIYLYFILVFFFIFIFAKIYTIIFFNSKESLIKVGLSSYGAAFGVIISSIVFEKIMPLKGKLIKYSILSLPLIYSLSKIACFISGCCYGIPYNGIFKVIYPSGLNIYLFPIQLLETIMFMVIFIVCHKLRNNKNIIWITIIISALMKFLLDFLRYEHINKIITVNQIVSIIFIIIAVVKLIINRKKKIS